MTDLKTRARSRDVVDDYEEEEEEEEEEDIEDDEEDEEEGGDDPDYDTGDLASEVETPTRRSQVVAVSQSFGSPQKSSVGDSIGSPPFQGVVAVDDVDELDVGDNVEGEEEVEEGGGEEEEEDTPATSPEFDGVTVQQQHQQAYQQQQAQVHPLLRAEDPPDVSLRGVSHEFLSQLVVKQKLDGLTTREVVRRYVLPQTFDVRCSLSALLRQVRPHAVSKATHYVCHSWDASFSRLVEMLGVVDASYDSQDPAYFWIDVFALNQRWHTEAYFRPPDERSEHRDRMLRDLKKAIDSTRQVCVILDPVDAPLLLTRSWCLYECAQAVSSGIPLHMCVCPAPPDDPEQARFANDVVGAFPKARESFEICFEQSKTTNPLDRQWLGIALAGLSSRSSEWLDERVGYEFRGWLADSAYERVVAFVDAAGEAGVAAPVVESLQEIARTLESIPANPAGLVVTATTDKTMDKTRMIKARDLLERAVKFLEKEREEMMDVGLNNGGGFATSEEETVAPRASDLSSLGGGDLSTFHGVATNGRLVAASSSDASGAPFSDVAHASSFDMASTGVMAAATGASSSSSSAPVTAAVTTTATTTLESLPQHLVPITRRLLQARHHLACVLARHFNELKVAEQLLRGVLDMRARLGDPQDSDSTMQSVEALARILKGRRRLSEAERLFQRVVEWKTTKLGVSHRETLLALNMFALTLQQREKYKEAEDVLRRVVSVGTDTLGAKSTDVLVWTNNLAVLLQDAKKLDDAEALFRATLRTSELSLGPSHPHTLVVVFNLGWCLWAQGRLRAAELFFRRELAGCQGNGMDTARSEKVLNKLLTEIETGSSSPASQAAATTPPNQPPTNNNGSTKAARAQSSLVDADPSLRPSQHHIEKAASDTASGTKRGYEGP